MFSKNVLGISMTLVIAISHAAFGQDVKAAELGTKQPFFLLCPHQEQFSAWSLYFCTDKSDPSKVLRLGIEKIVNRNSKESSYESVLLAQNNPNSLREQVGALEAADFGKKEFRIEDHDALHLSIVRVDDFTYRLSLSLRISMDERFTIGGDNRTKNDVVLRYDKNTKRWSAQALALVDFKNNKLLKEGGVPISGIKFPVTGTGIYFVYGILSNSEVVTLKDRTWRSDDE